MAITSLAEITDAQKEELVASLSCLVIGKAELTAESVQAVATASGNSISDSLAALFATVVGNSKDGMKTFTPPPGGGGGGGGGGYVEIFMACIVVSRIFTVPFFSRQYSFIVDLVFLLFYPNHESHDTNLFTYRPTAAVVLPQLLKLKKKKRRKKKLRHLPEAVVSSEVTMVMAVIIKETNQK